MRSRLISGCIWRSPETTTLSVYLGGAALPLSVPVGAPHATISGSDAIAIHTSFTCRNLRCVPAAAERPVQPHQRDEERALGARPRQLRGEELPLGIEDFQVGGDTRGVSRIREVERGGRRLDQGPLQSELLAGLVVGDERVVDVRERALQGRGISDRRLFATRLRRLEVRPEPPALEDGWRQARHELPRERRAGEQCRERGAGEAARGGKRELRQELRAGDADSSEGADELGLRLAQVGTAREELRGEPGRDVGWSILPGDRRPAPDARGIAAGEDRDRILL